MLLRRCAFGVSGLGVSALLLERTPGHAESADVYNAGADVCTVMFGRSQVGKSTTMGRLVNDGQAAPQVGDGSGRPVTTAPSLRGSLLGPLLDTPGIDDPYLRFTKEEAGLQVALGVLGSGVKRVKFLVFEDVGNAGGMQLRDTLASLEQTFGAVALKDSVVVVATKADLGYHPDRLRHLEEVMKDAGVEGKLVLWQNMKISDLDMQQQIQGLQAVLGRLPGVPLSQLETLKERQTRRAQELFMAQKPSVHHFNHEYEVNELIPYKVTEKYDDVEKHMGMIKYTTQEPYPIAEPGRWLVNQIMGSAERENLPWQVPTGGTGALGLASLAQAKEVTGLAAYLTTACSGLSLLACGLMALSGLPKREVTRTLGPVEQSRVVERERQTVKYREQIALKSEPRKVEYYRDVKEFLPQAAQEIIDEERKKYRRTTAASA